MFSKTVKKWTAEYGTIAAIVVLFLVARIVTLAHPAIAWWDASVYIGMGKYLFSHGAIGTWEVLRPVGLPLVLGLAWKLGLAPYAAGAVFSLAISAALIILAYLFAEDIKEGAGKFAALVLASSGLFFTFSAVPITDITSTFFALLSLYLAYRAATSRQYFFAGLAVSIAFLFRFPQGLLLVAGEMVIILKMFLTAPKKGRGAWNERIATMIEQCFVFAGGFFAVALPMLVINYYAYGNPFLPYIEGNAVIKQYPSLYYKGAWFYFGQLFKQDPLVLLVLAPVGLAWKKRYRTLGGIAAIIAVAVVMGYFVYQPHKELRYMLAFLPYVSVLTGVGLVYALDKVRVSEMLFLGLLAAAAIAIHAGAFLHPYRNQDTQVLYNFNTYFVQVPGARVLASVPYMLSYSDILLTHGIYKDWNEAYQAYNALGANNDYLALDSCGLEIGCADDSRCRDGKEPLLAELGTQATEVFAATTPETQCVLSIYKMRH